MTRPTIKTAEDICKWHRKPYALRCGIEPGGYWIAEMVYLPKHRKYWRTIRAYGKTAQSAIRKAEQEIKRRKK